MSQCGAAVCGVRTVWVGKGRQPRVVSRVVVRVAVQAVWWRVARR